MAFAMIVVLLYIVSAIVAAGAQSLPTCSGQAYDPSMYVCPNGKLCPTTNPCECPTASTAGASATFGCYSPSQYGCNQHGLTQNTRDTSAGSCIGSSSVHPTHIGDPIVSGFEGCRWYLQGKPGQVYNLISGPEDSLNTLLVPANLTDESHDNDGTFHGGLFIRHADHYITAFVDDAGNLEVKVDGAHQSVGNFSAGEVIGVVHQFLPFYGQAVDVTTPALTYFVHAVQPQFSLSGHARGHADVQVTLTKPLLDLHGLLGQSHGQSSRSCSQDYVFNGEGVESDYIVPALSELEYKYGRFGRRTTRSRKALEVSPSKFTSVTASIITA